MNYFSLISIELKKLRHSKILLLLLAPVIIMWIPCIINARKIFVTQGIPITPENNFFIQGFMGMVWFMLPATLIVCTVLLTQTERTNRGILKMLSLPVSIRVLCLSKFTVIVFLSAVQMLFSIAAYYISAAIASYTQHYSFCLDPLYVFSGTASFYLAAVPMAAVFWMIAVLVRSPAAAIGTGLASAVPSVLMINTKYWFLYPDSYPFYLLMVKYGQSASGIYETSIDWMPWLPAAAIISLLSLLISCICFGKSETRTPL